LAQRRRASWVGPGTGIGRDRHTQRPDGEFVALERKGGNKPGSWDGKDMFFAAGTLILAASKVGVEREARSCQVGQSRQFANRVAADEVFQLPDRALRLFGIQTNPPGREEQTRIGGRPINLVCLAFSSHVTGMPSLGGADRTAVGRERS